MLADSLSVYRIVPVIQLDHVENALPLAPVTDPRRVVLCGNHLPYRCRRGLDCRRQFGLPGYVRRRGDDSDRRSG